MWLLSRPTRWPWRSRAGTRSMREMTLRDRLRVLGDMPEWLVAITQPERLKAALPRCIPEPASATSSLKDVRPNPLRLQETSCLVTNVLNCWRKVKPERLEDNLALL